MSNFYFIKSRIIQKIKLYFDRLFVNKRRLVKNKKLDNPEPYPWRGLMIDTARHMPSIEWLEKKVDEMNLLGLNKLHLHLSDDQGFRVEIKKYPKLTSVAAYRNETVVDKDFPTKWTPLTKYIGDGKRYGGYYTQRELKKLVEYAKQKGVDIIPEIDIPGHATALLAAYPQFSAGPAPLAPATYWGIFPNVISDSSRSINFLKDIFLEIMEIFESQYIHIGGDEVILDNYGGDENIPKNILREIISFLNSKGKTVIVWDEATELVLGTKNIVMAWRSVQDGINALEVGARVVFCPQSHFYLDYYQHDPKSEPLAIGGYLPVEDVYSFHLEKIINNKKFAGQILGVQANMWTEYTKTEGQIDYMLYPRLYALSEVANRTNNNFKKFKEKYNLE